MRIEVYGYTGRLLGTIDGRAGQPVVTLRRGQSAKRLPGWRPLAIRDVVEDITPPPNPFLRSFQP
jgi:hypothetical protein